MDLSYQKYLDDFLDLWNKELEKEGKAGFDKGLETDLLSDMFLLFKRYRDVYHNSSLLYFCRERSPFVIFSFLGTIFYYYKRDWEKTWKLVEKLFDFSLPKDLRTLFEREVGSWLVQKEVKLKSRPLDPEPSANGIKHKKRGKGQREPEKRRGRPRGAHGANETSAIKGKTCAPKPEIICWKRERQWIISVEVPDEILEKAELSVIQNDLPLSRREYREGCWELAQIHGEVAVQWREDVLREKTIELSEQNYLTFKLTGDRGRRIKSVSTGSYLVVAPELWENDEELSGLLPLATEVTSIPGYLGHSYELDQVSNRKIAFKTPEGKAVLIEKKATRFELVGNKLDEASEGMGPLFGGSPPKIRSLDGQEWENIEKVVVFEEGIGGGNWSLAFAPEKGYTKQVLPPEIGARKGGWYSLRFYDGENDLIESMDFRFSVALREIKILQQPPLPFEGGGGPVFVELFHEPRFSMKPADMQASEVQVESTSERTLLTIPANPTFDETHWLIGQDTEGFIAISILVERIWWALSDENEIPLEWKDTHLCLSRENFAATSTMAVWIRTPKPDWVREVNISVGESAARRFALRHKEHVAVIPLREFCDCQELRGLSSTTLIMSISYKGANYSKCIAEITLNAGCNYCDYESTDLGKIISHVTTEHMNEIFRLLTYDELRTRVSSLPPAIYQCHHCKFYVASDDWRNPTSSIINHIEDCHNDHVGNGPPKIWYRVVLDALEIRDNLLKDIMLIHKCTICGREFEETNSEDMGEHIFVNHSSEICTLR